MGIVQRSGNNEQREAGSDAPATGGTGSRRALLAAGGGMLLAASGLLLPAWLAEEAEAGESPVHTVQNRKRRRRQKRHRDLKHRRKEKRNDQQPAPTNKWRAGISFAVTNDGAAPLGMHPYSYYSDGGLFSPDTWHAVIDGGTSVDPGQTRWERWSYTEGALYIDNRFWLMANNPSIGWPEIYLRYDGKLEPATFVGYTGKSAISGMGFVADFPAIERTIDGRRFTIQRKENESWDGQPHVVFDVHVS